MSQTSVGNVVITMGANTAKFSVDLSRAEAKMAGFSKSVNMKLREIGNGGATNGFKSIKKEAHETITAVQGTSAALRALEGAQNFRAGERFLATTLQLGPAFQKLFPIFGALALGDIVTNWINKVNEFREALKNLSDAPEHIAQAFRAINDPIQQQNDELGKANAKLQNDINLLQGKPTNNLATAIYDARIEADKLGASLSKDLAGVDQLLAQNKIGLFGRIMGKAETGDVEKQIADFEKKVNDATLSGNAAVHNAKTPEAANAARDALNSTLGSLYATEIQRVAAQKAAVDKVQKDRGLLTVGWQQSGMSYSEYSARTLAARKAGDQAAIQADLQGYLRSLYTQDTFVGLTDKNVKLQGTKDVLTLSKHGTAASNPFADRIAALKAQLAGVNALASAPAGDSMAQALAKGYGDAAKEISSLNQGQTKLTLGQQSQITILHDQIALAELKQQKQKEWQTTLQQIASESQDMQEKDREAYIRQVEHLRQVQLQIDEINRTAANASKGADAIFRGNYNAMPTGTPEQMADKRKTLAEHNAGIAESVANLNRQTEATQRLNAVANLGRDAQRQAAINNIRNSGQSPDVIDAQVKALKAQNQLQDSQQMLGGTARDGATRYFSEMKDNVQSTAKSVHDVLGNAFSGLNDQLGALVSGQKTSWSGFFAGLASQIANIGLNKLEGNLFGSLFGSNSGSKSGGGGFLSSIVGFTSKLFGGGRAIGGGIDASKFYMVGENGPELFAPGVSGNITPNNKLKSVSGGSGAMYYVDARGANAADVESRVQRALAQVHGSAIQGSVAVQAEMKRRMPRSKFA